MTDEEIQNKIIEYAFSHYQKRGTVDAKPLNKQLTKWMREHNDSERLNEIYNSAEEALKEACPEAYEFMDKMFRFGCIRYEL